MSAPFTAIAQAPFGAATRRDPGPETASLIRDHLAGDPRAFTLLVTRYRNRLLAFVFRMIGDRERAEDLVQEAFIRVHRHLHRFDRQRKFTTWLYTIASNLAKNELRNRSRSPLVYERTLRGPVGDESRPVEYEDSRSRPDLVQHRRHLQEAVERAVTRLSPHQREVFVLRELEGKSYEEIAVVTGCNLGTVKSRLNRARQHFAEIIAPDLE